MDATQQGDLRSDDTHEATSEEGAAHGLKKKVAVEINSQKVTMTKGKHTGADIKDLAIAQRVALEVDFVLSVRRGSRYDVVGDDDVVKVREGMEFVAVAPDDNS